MTDARPIGYGAMLAEGALGLLAVLAATAGFADSTEWHASIRSALGRAGLSAVADGVADATAAAPVGRDGYPGTNGSRNGISMCTGPGQGQLARSTARAANCRT